MVSESREIGDKGELAAENLLRSKGLRILHKNWRKGSLELDLVCLEDDIVVFVEVKTRRAGGLACTPADTLGGSKKNSLRKAARAWLAENNAWDRPSRFDLVFVIFDGKYFSPEHICDVLDFSRPVGGGHSYWQPW